MHCNIFAVLIYFICKNIHFERMDTMKRKLLSLILCICMLVSVVSVGLVGSTSAKTVTTYLDKVSLTFDGDAPYGIPVHRGVKVLAYENGYAKLQNNAKGGGTAYIGKDGTVGASPAYYKNDTAEVLAEAKSNLFMCEAGKTYRLKFDFKYLAGTGGLTKKVSIWLHPDPTATSISDYDLSDRATLVESQAATMTIAETETVLTEDTEWATAYYIFTVNDDQTDGVAIGMHPGYSATYASLLAIDNLTISEVAEGLEYNESRLHTMDDATNDAYIVGSGCNDGTALVDNYDEEHGSVLKLVGGDYARLGFEDLDVKQNRKYYVYFDAKAETDNAQPVMVLGVNGSGTKSCRFFFMGYQTPYDKGASFFIDGKQVTAANLKFSTEWQRYGIVIDTSNEELLAKITAYKANFWNSAIHFLFGVSGATAYFDNVQIIEVQTIPDAVPAENDASAAASIRTEKKAADNNGVYRSAGLRFRGTIDNSVKETADEIGFLVAPSSSVMADTDWYKLESGLNPIVRQGVCYEKNGKDIVYEQGTNQTAYQMILTGLSTEDGKTAYMRRFTAVMYVKSGETYTYYALGETSYNQVAATCNVMNIKIDTLSHYYESSITKYPSAFEEGEKTFICKFCKHTYTEKLPKTFKVLAFGNSFSADAMAYLWDIANNAGVENIVLGNINISGCSLDTHWDNIVNGVTVNYRKNTTGTWEGASITVAEVLADEEWDIISLQQNSANSAFPDTYGNLNNLVNYISDCEPNARIVWHLTWSYQHTSQKEVFEEFDRDPIKMYNAIVSTYKEKVEPCELITSVTPSGTAVQNLRSSYIGDTITRDGFHMSYSYGRYLVGLTWFAALTGGDVDSITWVPSDYPELADDLPVIRQSVKDAIKTPFAITQQATTK